MKEVRYLSNLRALAEPVEPVDGKEPVEPVETLAGTAIVFNTPSNLLGGDGGMFKEIILPSAVTPALISESDIFMLYNHDENLGVLARSKNGSGTLGIEITPEGVNYNFQVPDTNLGEDLYESVSRGDITSSSFAFTVAEDGQSWERLPDGTYLRTISKFERLYDFSIVPNPAYSESVVSARGLEELKEKEKEELEAAKAKLEAEKKAELEEYYKKYDEYLK